MTAAAAAGLLMEPARLVGFIFLYLVHFPGSGTGPGSILKRINLICLYSILQPIVFHMRDFSLCFSYKDGHAVSLFTMSFPG